MVYFKKTQLMLLIVVVGVIAAGCTSSQSQSQQMGKYYSENYPQTVTYQQKDPSGVQTETARRSDQSFWNDDGSEQPLNISKVISAPSTADETSPGTIRAIASEDSKVVEEMPPFPDQHFGADDVLGQNTSSMIEGKIFRLVEEAYRKRNYQEFIKLYSLFIESFPHSSQKGFLDERKREFFYYETLRTESLKGALVDIKYPDARSMDEFKEYFQKLSDHGMKAVQIDVVQYVGDPIFLFAGQEKKEGYYFENSFHLLVDNLLPRIVDAAHSKGLKIYASFPLRRHPGLGDYSRYILDETWNAFQNRTTPNSKLDLLNPEGMTYLLELVKEVLDSRIDGIVLKDDFTYEMTEGFSEVAIDRFITDTGRPINLNNLFVPVRSAENQAHQILTSSDFDDVALWRSREIKQCLWEIIAYIREIRSDFTIGLELTPEMVLEESNSLKWHSTGITYLKDLDVDLYILKWRKQNGESADLKTFNMAAQQLGDEVVGSKEIFLKIPLDQKSKNIIEYNKRIDTHTAFQKTIRGARIAIGPVDRMEQLDVVN